MRIVFVGAGEVTYRTARALIGKGHEVVIVESDKSRIDELSEDLDCSFLLGDGSRPDTLREVDPPRTDILFCLTNNDQANILASLVGRSLGFQRVVTSIANAQFEVICQELGLQDTIVPSRTISRYLEDMVGGSEAPDLSALIKEDARLFAFVAKDEDAVAVGELKLPAEARVIAYYRAGKFAMPDPETKLQKGDEVLILTHSGQLDALRERWQPQVPPPKRSLWHR